MADIIKSNKKVAKSAKDNKLQKTQKRFTNLCMKVWENYSKSYQEQYKLPADWSVHIGDVFNGDYLIKVTGFKKDKYGTYIVVDWFEPTTKKWHSYNPNYRNHPEFKKDKWFINHKDFVTQYSPKKNFKDVDIEAMTEKAQAMFDGGEMPKDYTETPDISDGTDLMHMGKQETYENMHAMMESKKMDMTIIKSTFLAMVANKKHELEKIAEEFGQYIIVLQKQMEKVMDIIITIELYLGIEEKVLVMTKGDPAPSNEPICIRQQLLFMDEEVGDPRTDGLGVKYDCIEDFDEWVIRDENYKKLIPELKGIVSLRVRRDPTSSYSGDRHPNPYMQAAMDREDMMTYILLRNGDNLYRIWTDKISFTGGFFPHSDEIQILQDISEYVEESAEENKDRDYFNPNKEEFEKVCKRYYVEFSFHGSIDYDEIREKLEKKVFNYKKRFTLLQGLVDRTEFFNPKPPISFFNPDAIKDGLYKLIFDDERQLPDGRLGFWEWVASLNVNIVEGSRIVIAWSYREHSRHSNDRSVHRFDDRYGRYRDTNHNLPAAPKEGLYTVKSSWGEVVGQFDDYESIGEKKAMRGDKYYKQEEILLKYLCVRYNPEDEIGWTGWTYDPHTRQVPISYKIKLTDRFIINYDYVTIEDIDFYLDSRVNRREYLDMMPVLWKIREIRIEEIKQEKDFARFIEDDLQRQFGIETLKAWAIKKKKDVIDQIWTDIKWYKLKVKVKRPITKDETKAFRMIIGLWKNRLQTHKT